MTDEKWIIDENNLTGHRREVRNTIFTLGNGAFETNGSTPFATRGRGWTFVAGLYADAPPTVHFFPAVDDPARNSEDFPSDRDCFRHTTPGFVICPNIFAMRLRYNGRRVQESTACRRTLDLKNGSLRSDCDVQTPEGFLRLSTTRFVSLSDIHFAAERIEIRAEDAGDAELTLEVDTTQRNNNGYDLFENRKVEKLGSNLLAWHGVTVGREGRLSVCLIGRGPGNAARTEATDDELRLTYSVKLEKGKTLVFDRFIGLASSALDTNPAEAARKSCERAAAAGFEACLARQSDDCARFWKENDIVIVGPADEQRGLRYCVFQLRCGTPPTDRLSMGAKLFSGEHYRGCVFWDVDMFILPYLIKAQPDAARRHVLYRYHTLPGAISNAKRLGNKGARYPWEGMPDGADALGAWVIFAVTQVHVAADVAWGVMEYYRWSGDEEYMQNYGKDILAETARFWTSRVAKTGRGYEITKVCGPDEAHARINNSVYTNTLAAENLRLAAKFNPQLPEDERKTWLDIAENLVIHKPRPDGLLEQCDGFFDLPEAPPGVDSVDPDAYKYQILKQADVVMLPVVFPSLLTEEQIAVNYDYYEPRTTHRSTLSEGIHAIVAARVGKEDEAYRMFRNALFTDIENRQGNTEGGLHAAAIGTAPRMVMEGFAGLRLADGKPTVTPQLPETWKSVEFSFYYRNRRYHCKLDRKDNGKTVECKSAE